ncbi:MAG TPA: methyltransferase domain-containing protein [Stellaceae bacterium]|nr:methyltransferase domain-containing protein [Stellaceae bacterium]
MRPARVNYDTIAHLFDGQPYRAKSVDAELLAFIGDRGAAASLSILDIGCGTGNQLVADRRVVPEAQLVGADRSLGMLRQAQPKAADIAWVQADAAMLPFQAESFDFLTCQHALHHVEDKTGMLRETFRVLRPGGRLVVHSLCPQESPDWLYYEYFPEAHAIDLADFWPPEAIAAAMKTNGFLPVTLERHQIHYQQNMRDWLKVLHRRDTNSQLMTISDAAYEAGLRRLQTELDNARSELARAEHLCLVTIRADKRSQ